MLFNNLRSILMYHSVGSEYFSVLKKNFINHVKLYQKCDNGFLSESNDKSLNLFVTFDDGYIDNYNVVFPLLIKYGIKITLFVSTKYIGKTAFFGRYKKVEVINKNMINEMAKSGFVEFGSHTHNHVDLTVCNENKIEYELKKSKEIIEDIIGMPIINFSYPYGKTNPVVEKVLKYLNYSFAVCGQEDYLVDTSNPYLLPRWEIHNNINNFKINLKLNGGLMIKRLIHKLL